MSQEAYNVLQQSVELNDDITSFDQSLEHAVRTLSADKITIKGVLYQREYVTIAALLAFNPFMRRVLAEISRDDLNEFDRIISNTRDAVFEKMRKPAPGLKLLTALNNGLYINNPDPEDPFGGEDPEEEEQQPDPVQDEE